MSFQSTINRSLGGGVVGEVFVDAPFRIQPKIINTISPFNVNNVFGNAFSISSLSEGQVTAGNASGTLPFAGILVNPKNIPLFGTAGFSLGASLVVPNFTVVEILSMGSVWVNLPASAIIGDWVIFDNVTGVLSTVSPGASLPSGKSWAMARVDYFNVASPGFLSVITLDPGIGQPT